MVKIHVQIKHFLARAIPFLMPWTLYWMLQSRWLSRFWARSSNSIMCLSPGNEKLLVRYEPSTSKLQAWNLIPVPPTRARNVVGVKSPWYWGHAILQVSNINGFGSFLLICDIMEMSILHCLVNYAICRRNDTEVFPPGMWYHKNFNASLSCKFSFVVGIIQLLSSRALCGFRASRCLQP